MYVGSAENEQYDQELEDVFVGPVNVGTNQFVFQVCAAPFTRPLRPAQRWFCFQNVCVCV